MKVNKNDIFVDDEDEIVHLELMLTRLHGLFEEMPRWFFLKSEWNEYLFQKGQIKRRLSILKENLGYNNAVAD